MSANPPPYNPDLGTGDKAEYKPDGMPPPYPGSPAQVPQYSPGYPYAAPSYPSQAGGGVPYPGTASPYPGQYPQGGPTQGPGSVNYTSTGSVIIQQPGTNVIVHQSPQYRQMPVITQCPNCRVNITTAVDFETGTCTWVMCLVICLLGFDCGCCLIPFCVDECKDAYHSCPNCKQHISSYKRM